MRYFASALLATIIAVALPGVALAAYGYVISVPATLTNMPSGAVATAICNIFAGTNASGTLLLQNMASAPTRVNGSYNGTFTVSASTPTKAGSYRCWMDITMGGFNSANLVGNDPGSPSPGWTGTMQTVANIP
jgi:hypothetical protein